MSTGGFKRKVWPGTNEKVIPNGIPTPGVTGGDSNRLIFVDAKAGDVRKPTDERKSRRDVGDRVNKESEVVSKRERVNAWVERNVVKKRVIGDDEEEGGEGTPLLDPPFDIDPVGEKPTKEGGNTDEGKRSFDKVPEPGGEAGFDQDMRNPVMVYRIKSFRSIEEKEELVFPFFNRFVEKGVDINHVLRTLLASKEALLRGADVPVNTRHNAPSHTGCENPVIGIRDTEWAGVREETSEFFREQKEEPMIKAFGGKVSLEDSTQDVPKDRAS